jgi:hypothetical protein
LVGSFKTVAVNCWVVFSGSRSAPAGAEEIVIAGIVTVAEPVAEGLAAEAAMIVTVKSLRGGADGAV